MNLTHHEEMSAKEAGRMAAMAKFNGFTDEQIKSKVMAFIGMAPEKVINRAREYYTKFNKEIASHPASKNSAYVSFCAGHWTYTNSIDGMKKSAEFGWVLRVIS